MRILGQSLITKEMGFGVSCRWEPLHWGKTHLGIVYLSVWLLSLYLNLLREIKQDSALPTSIALPSSLYAHVALLPAHMVRVPPFCVQY